MPPVAAVQKLDAIKVKETGMRIMPHFAFPLLLTFSVMLNTDSATSQSNARGLISERKNAVCFTDFEI